MAAIDLKKCTITLEDGTTGTPNSVEVIVGEGNCTYGEKRNVQYIKNKGALDTTREGDEEPVDVKMDFRWEYLTGTTTTGSFPSVEEALKGHGAAKDWVSSDTEDPCAPYAVNVVIEYDPTINSNAGCSLDKETITLADFRWESLEHDMKSAQVSVTGKCNITEADIVRASSGT